MKFRKTGAIEYMKKHATYRTRRLRVRRSRAKKILNKFLKVFYYEGFGIENLKKLLRIFLHGSYGTVNTAPNTWRVSSYDAWLHIIVLLD